MKILVVDDSRSLRHSLHLILEVISAVILDAGDGLEALEVLEREGPVDLVLLDIEMPRMDGITFLEVVKKDPRWASIPVIVLSGVGQRESIIKAVQEGAKQYLTKPFTSSELLSRIVQALEIEGGRIP
ncbi:MAG: response regulator [Fibrobacteria bacterium]|nr:response regulator [Fibrobacteria bacterium]